ncbi:hypothetical protein PGT21_017914 [Puccinia graminis f. sp. tritici]|uniref:Uncharacterized protein n=2 Tax=Puccinia graminis f. sp. tritici TaxID=56615 RepID=E3K4I2_PUCGT|nr:uncharacterized protein PGTG_05489 [Puccinia graminis f. sp. tritici CRL 75-36-700-3]EFP79168.1 hypothetical protein PGTG_05489 [Puccinia graminis f. sp. tritici CRL 75-36-700-3]KAA1086977.1 hypothetical protein PGT21_017914 [Puccinia graminis f. sp. tritici]
MVSSRFISHFSLLIVLALAAIATGAAIPARESRSDDLSGCSDGFEDIYDNVEDYDEPPVDATLVTISVTKFVSVEPLMSPFEPISPEEDFDEEMTPTIIEVSVIELTEIPEEENVSQRFDSDAEAEVDDESRLLDCDHEYLPHEFNTAPGSLYA